MLACLFAAVVSPLLLATSSNDAEQRALQQVLDGVVAREQATLPVDRLHPARVSAVVVDTATGVSASVDADRPVYLASGIKLFVLIEAFRQRRQHLLSFDEEIPFTLEDVRDGAPTMNREPLNARYTVRQLIKWMVRDSDNAAFDLVLRRLGADTVAEQSRRFGPLGPVVSTLQTRRAVYSRLDERAAALTPLQIRDVRWRDGWHPRLDLLEKHLGTPRGRLTSADLDRAWAAHYATGVESAPLTTAAHALVALHNGSAVSPDDDREMLALLRDVATSDRRIEGDLPGDVVVAHKTGSLHKRLCDLGVITMKDGSHVVVVVAVAGADFDRSEEAVAHVSRAAYDVVVEARGVR